MTCLNCDDTGCEICQSNPTAASAFEDALHEVYQPETRNDEIHAGILEGARWAREYTLTSEPVAGLVEAAKAMFTRCHTGALMIDVCISDYHDRAHEHFIESEQGEREVALSEAIAAYEKVKGG